MEKKSYKETKDLVSIYSYMRSLLINEFNKIFKLQLVIIILIIISLFFFNFLKLKALERETEVLSKLLKKYASYVLVATPDGRVMMLQKVKLNQDMIAEYIASIIKEYLVFDLVTLTDNYKKTFSNFKSFVKYLKEKGILKKLKTFFYSTKELLKFLKLYYVSLSSLADNIKVKNVYITEIKEIKHKKLKNLYKVSGKINVILTVLDEKNKAELYEDEGEFEMYVVISPLYGSAINPYGLKIVKIVKFPVFTR